jgi:hypothetical protein
MKLVCYVIGIVLSILFIYSLMKATSKDRTK